MGREALIILVGITAGSLARRRARRYFMHHSEYTVLLPTLPYRAGLRPCAAWLSHYLADTVAPMRFSAVHVIAYIAGGYLLRCFDRGELPDFARLVQFRSPIQERVAPALVQRLGRTAVGWLQGRGVLDLADGWTQDLPQPRLAQQQGLIIEQGRSRLARLFGIGAGDAAAWRPERLLPDADAVLRIPESNDVVYSSEPVLGAALQFIRSGRFPEQP
jgi:hypothetical protein